MKSLFLFIAAMLVFGIAGAQTGNSDNEKKGQEISSDSSLNSAYTTNAERLNNEKIPEIKFSNITTRSSRQGVQISWSSANVENGSLFEIERSSNGTNFYSLGSVPANNSGNFYYLDNNPLNNTSYYRIGYLNSQNNSAYSKTISVQVLSRDALKAYYNGSQLMVNLDLSNRGNFKIALINASGQVVSLKDVNYDGSLNAFSLNTESRLTYGIYSVIVKGENTSLSTQVLVK